MGGSYRGSTPQSPPSLATKLQRLINERHKTRTLINGCSSGPDYILKHNKLQMFADLAAYYTVEPWVILEGPNGRISLAALFWKNSCDMRYMIGSLKYSIGFKEWTVEGKSQHGRFRYVNKIPTTTTNTIRNVLIVYLYWDLNAMPLYCV